jgi:translation initiation factor 2-alpha kinase 4
VRKILDDLLLIESKKRISATRLASQLLETSHSGSSHETAVALPSTPKSSEWPTKLGQPPLFSPAAPTTTAPSKSFEKQVGFFWQPRSLGSRYRQEFEQLEPLGRGGGGQVVKARNRLDGHLYAVKKIRLPDDRASEVKILREVTIWSRMNHPK